MGRFSPLGVGPYTCSECRSAARRVRRLVALWRERNKFRREHSRKRGRMKDFKDKTAVITGGASGIGLAFARCFGREGCRLVLADVEAPALHAAVQQLRAEGLDAVGRVADVAHYEDVEALAAF